MYINLFNQKKPSINKIYVSKPELKFTNNKVVITIHTYNREKLVLLAKIKQLRTIFLKKLVEFILRNNKIFNSINSNTTKKVLKTFLHKEIMILEKYKVRTLTNQYKYKEIFLYKLGTLINTLYKKKVLFNIINLKSLTFNTDILTEMVDLRINKLDSSITYILKYLLNKVKLPKVNRTLEKLGIIKSVNNSLIQNKHKDLYLNSILNQNNFDEKLNELYLNLNKNQKNNIVDIIFNDIKYKNIGGIRLEIKGRITRRFKAEKTRSKVK
jgi:hypothetical protein